MRKQHATRHPWEAWFKRGKFTLVRTVDYQCHTGSMVKWLRVKAGEMGISVSVRVHQDQNGLTVWVRGERDASDSSCHRAGYLRYSETDAERSRRLRADGEGEHGEHGDTADDLFGD